MIQESNAKEEIAITPRSVLLSTITRKAPIPLVSQSNNVLRPTSVQIPFLDSIV